MASNVQATSKFNLAFFSSSKLGSKINFPSSFNIILTQETGPSNGDHVIIKAKLAQVIQKNHKSFSFEEERAVAII
jgi:hypothetical protein